MSIDGPGGIKNIRKSREFFQPMKRERILSPQNLELFASLQSTFHAARMVSRTMCRLCSRPPFLRLAIVTGLDMCKNTCASTYRFWVRETRDQSRTFSSAMRMSTLWYPGCSRFSTSPRSGLAMYYVFPNLGWPTTLNRISSVE